MFLLITVLWMAGLAALNYLVSRSPGYPPALFAVAWTVLFALLPASGEMYYPISPETMLVYPAWAGGLSAGALGAPVVPAQRIIGEAVYA
jgi:hypothetical protein